MIKQGDKVIVLTGTDKGKQGKVLRVFRALEKATVEGLNIKKKHQKPRKQGEKGQTINLPHPISLSNLGLFCSTCKKGARVGATDLKGKKARVCVKCKNQI